MANDQGKLPLHTESFYCCLCTLCVSASKCFQLVSKKTLAKSLRTRRCESDSRWGVGNSSSVKLKCHLIFNQPQIFHQSRVSQGNLHRTRAQPSVRFHPLPPGFLRNVPCLIGCFSSWGNPGVGGNENHILVIVIIISVGAFTIIVVVVGAFLCTRRTTSHQKK